MSRNLVVCSLFRDSSCYIKLYLNQAAVLNPTKVTRYVWIYGDSTDDTEVMLKYPHLYSNVWSTSKRDVTLIRKDMGNAKFGSVVSLNRFIVLSELANTALDQVKESDDYVLWLESDLIMTKETFGFAERWMRKMEEHPYIGAIGGNVLHYGTDVFYDLYAYKSIKCETDWDKWGDFGPKPPYIDPSQVPAVYFVDSGLVEMKSIGSCILMRAKYILDGARFKSDGAILALCYEMRKRGCRIFYDPNETIYHPFSL